MLRLASVMASGLIMGYFFGNIAIGVALSFGIDWLMSKPAY